MCKRVRKRVRKRVCKMGVQKGVCKRRCAKGGVKKGYKLPSDLNPPPPLPQKLVTPPPCLCACPGVVLDIREGQRGPSLRVTIFFGGRTLSTPLPPHFCQRRAPLRLTFCWAGGSPPPRIVLDIGEGHFS